MLAQKTSQLPPWLWNSLMHSLISLGEFSGLPYTGAHNCYANHTMLYLFHKVPIKAGWTEAMWNPKLAQSFYTWPALGIEAMTPGFFGRVP